MANGEEMTAGLMIRFPGMDVVVGVFGGMVNDGKELDSPPDRSLGSPRPNVELSPDDESIIVMVGEQLRLPPYLVAFVIRIMCEGRAIGDRC